MVGVDFGGFECVQDVVVQFQCVVDGFYFGCEGGEFVVVEVGLLCVGGYDEVVVWCYCGYVY